MVATSLALALLLTRSQETTAKGLARVEQGDVPAARAAAIRAGLRQAVAQVAGEWVESHFSTEAREVSSNATHEMSQQVQETLRVDVQGFVESYRVESEAQRPEGYEVVIRARVDKRKLSSLMEALALAIENAGRKPRVLLLSRERDVSNGEVLVSFADALVRKELLGAGLELVGRDEGWDDDADASAKKLGADVIVWVDAEYKNCGVIGPGAELEALVGQTRAEVKLTLRSELVRAKRMLSSTPIVTTSIGIDFMRALRRALQGGGDNVIASACRDFFTQLKAALEDKSLEIGRTHVIVRRVGSYARQGRPLVALVEALDGVSRVQEGALEETTLHLTVEHRKERAGWERELFDACRRQPWCATLDKVGADAERVILSF